MPKNHTKPPPAKKKSRQSQIGHDHHASSQPTPKAAIHSRNIVDAGSENRSKSQTTKPASKKKVSKHGVSLTHKRNHSGTEQTESSTSHNTQSSGPKSSPPTKPASKRLKKTTPQTPVDIEHDSEPEAQSPIETVDLSDASNDEYQVSHPEEETEPDTDIDEEDPDSHDETPCQTAAARPKVQKQRDGSGHNGARTVRISTTSGSQNVVTEPSTPGSRVRITGGIPLQSQLPLSSSLIR